MTEIMTTRMEEGLLILINDYLEDVDVYLSEGEYQRVIFRIYDDDAIKEILKAFKFKDIGNVYKYPDILPQPEIVRGDDISNNYDMFQRIAVSSKINSIVLYSAMMYSFDLCFLIDKKYLKKFSKQIKPILQLDTRANLFKNTDFNCKKKEYLEVTDVTDDSDKYVSVQKKKVRKESLVFDTASEIFNVMNDIHTFFEKETKELYEKMNIVYKRGIILYGDPGNGKSAMIREIIRQVPEITKVIINPNVKNVTKILSSLIDALNGKRAIIIIEDIDSLITSDNRSEFLNILDGIDVKSGIYFIGTTNYPDQIDPAFMNRSGRFDRTYRIDNPSELVRKSYFQNHQIGDLLSSFKLHKENSENKDLNAVDIFVKYSNDLSMANLKELMISSQYMLASNKTMSIEEAVETNYAKLTKIKETHDNAFNSFREQNRFMSGRKPFL